MQAYPGAQINVAFGAAQGVQAVAPLPADSSASATAEAQADTSVSSGRGFVGSNLGLIVFGAAGVVLIAGMGVTILMMRRR